MEPAILPDDKIPLNGRPPGTIRERPQPESAFYRYGMLVVLLGFLAYAIHWRMTLSSYYTGDRNLIWLIPAGLLLNHLAWSFRWPPLVDRALGIIAGMWIAFGIGYMFCYSDQQRERTPEPVRISRSSH